jgi:two-component system chemotaxis response regulator CheB
MTVRVLIVDDSPTMRGIISAVLRQDPEIEIVGTAGDPLEARQAIKQLDPDVVTLDIEMPNMNGLEFLEKIMRLRPTPVVMVSTLTQAGADASVSALALGAVDCVGKPIGGATDDNFRDLAERVKAAAQAKVRDRQAVVKTEARTQFVGNGKLIAIGSSTGGVEALLTILSRFPADCPATVITQHMPPTFTKSFADRLNRTCQPTVAEATEGAPLLPGHVYVAPGGTHHLKVGGTGQRRCQLVEGPTESGHRPSVDTLFHSVAHSFGPNAVGVILTGMGRDGAAGLLAMRKAGAHTIGQDERSSVVYGMPKAAFECGAVERQASLPRIADTILDTCEVQQRRAV